MDTVVSIMPAPPLDAADLAFVCFALIHISERRMISHRSEYHLDTKFHLFQK